jgi:hypothetical protein
MATQDVRVTNIPDTSNGSVQRVALDLAQICMHREGGSKFTSRAEVLKLYYDCHRAAQGYEYKAS